MGIEKINYSDKAQAQLQEALLSGWTSPIQLVVRDVASMLNITANTIISRLAFELNLRPTELRDALEGNKLVYQKAYEDGYSLGYKQGKAEAIEAMKDYIKEKGKTDG